VKIAWSFAAAFLLASFDGAFAQELAGAVKQGEVAYQKGDYATALRLWLPAANQGDANAQFDLGVVHVNGRGVLQDYVVAHMWFSLAAARGDTKAAEHRDMLAKDMSPAQLADAQKMARDFNQKRSRTSGRSTRN
jgi:TPR repeat protein